MRPAPVNEIVSACIHWAQQECGALVECSEATGQVADWLLGERALWDACEAGIVTRAELAAGIAARFSTWLGHRLGRLLVLSGSGSDTLTEGIESVVVRFLEQDGPTTAFEFTADELDGADATVDGSATGKLELLDLLGRALSFPEYFGRNWDALRDCIRDLSWIDRAVVTIDHSEIPPLSDRDLVIYVEILAEAVRELTQEGRCPRLRVGFRTKDRDAIERALRG